MFFDIHLAHNIYNQLYGKIRIRAKRAELTQKSVTK